ncbi:MAG: hypothetical protein CM1200mP2_12070 [Planctomycetaceae bacterium]|nr:MAG: hypothetical protein CM1200mP2_12070 [Planctomycetaceae bacterium]
MSLGTATGARWSSCWGSANNRPSHPVTQAGAPMISRPHNSRLISGASTWPCWPGRSPARLPHQHQQGLEHLQGRKQAGQKTTPPRLPVPIRVTPSMHIHPATTARNSATAGTTAANWPGEPQQHQGQCHHQVRISLDGLGPPSVQPDDHHVVSSANGRSTTSRPHTATPGKQRQDGVGVDDHRPSRVSPIRC